MWPLKIAALSGGALAAYLASMGLSGSNAGADFERAVYWLPSTADSASAPRFASEAEFFAQFTRAGSATYLDSDGLIKTAAANVPRFDWSTGKRRLLLEGAATNDVLWSDQLDNAAWAKNGCTVSANAATSPAGDATADVFVENSANAMHFLQNPDYNYVASTTYTVSIYAKAGTRSILRLQAYALSGGGQAYFNLSSGVSGNAQAGTTAAMVPLTDGWWRCSITWTQAATAIGNVNFGPALTMGGSNSYQGAGGTMMFWCAGREIGSFATSPIITAGVAVTRATDSFFLPVGLTSVLQRAAGCAMVKGQRTSATSNINGRSIGTNNGFNHLLSYRPSDGIAETFTTGPGLDAVGTTGAVFATATSWDATGRFIATRGGVTDADAVTNVARSGYYLGRDQTNSEPGTGLYGMIAEFPFRPSNANVSALVVA